MKALNLLLVGSLTLMGSCITGGELFERGILAHYGDNSSTGWQQANGEKLTNPVASNDESIGRGKTLFGAHCSGCHGSSGYGNGPDSTKLDPPPANLYKTAEKRSDGYLFLQISQGRLGMPIWKKRLETNQRWDIVNYLKSLNSLGAEK